MNCGDCMFYVTCDDWQGCQISRQKKTDNWQCHLTVEQIATAIAELADILVKREQGLRLCGCGDYFTPERDDQRSCATCEMCNRMDADE